MTAVRKWPLTTFALAYAAIVAVLFASHAIEPSEANIVRLAIAGFLVTFAAVIAVVFYFYLPSARVAGWRGLLPRHVVKVTAASVGTIAWVVAELLARAAGGHFDLPGSLALAGLDAFLWLWSLSDVMRFEQRRVDLSSRTIELRNDRGDRRRSDRRSDA
jgi:cation transport ATPase